MFFLRSRSEHISSSQMLIRSEFGEVFYNDVLAGNDTTGNVLQEHNYEISDYTNLELKLPKDTNNHMKIDSFHKILDGDSENQAIDGKYVAKCNKDQLVIENVEMLSERSITDQDIIYEDEMGHQIVNEQNDTDRYRGTRAIDNSNPIETEMSKNYQTPNAEAAPTASLEDTTRGEIDSSENGDDSDSSITLRSYRQMRSDIPSEQFKDADTVTNQEDDTDSEVCDTPIFEFVTVQHSSSTPTMKLRTAPLKTQKSTPCVIPTRKMNNTPINRIRKHPAIARCKGQSDGGSEDFVFRYKSNCDIQHKIDTENTAHGMECGK